MLKDLISAQQPKLSTLAIYGEPFSGKTTLANKAKKALFLSTDGNASLLSKDVIKLNSTKDFATAVKEIKEDKDYEVIILDTLDELCSMAEKEIIRREGVTSLADVAYGKLTGEWKGMCSRMIDFFLSIATVGKTVVILSHLDRREDGTLALNLQKQVLDNLTGRLHCSIRCDKNNDASQYIARIDGKRCDIYKDSFGENLVDVFENVIGVATKVIKQEKKESAK